MPPADQQGIEEIGDDLGTDTSGRPTDADARARLARDGPNQLAATPLPAVNAPSLDVSVSLKSRSSV